MFDKVRTPCFNKLLQLRPAFLASVGIQSHVLDESLRYAASVFHEIGSWIHILEIAAAFQDIFPGQVLFLIGNCVAAPEIFHSFCKCLAAICWYPISMMAPQQRGRSLACSAILGALYPAFAFKWNIVLCRNLFLERSRMSFITVVAYLAQK